MRKLGLLLAAAAATTAMSMDILENPPETMELAVQQGHPAVIRLRENCTTGYSWTAEYDKDVVMVEIRHIPANVPEGIAGAAGHAEILISVPNGKSGKVRLKYARPWEKGVPPIRETTVSVIGGPDAMIQTL